MEHKHSLLKSFGYAFEGLVAAIKKGRNFKIQIILGVLAIALGIFLNISTTEWLALIIAITFVLVLELVNTSIEAVVDLASPQIHPKAKLAKDVVAGAVLIASIGSLIIGILLFLPKLILLF
jgi:diacylglycerol kinase